MRRSPVVFVLAIAVSSFPAPPSAEDFSVGVITGDGTCPPGSAGAWHYMDEEDDPYGDHLSPDGLEADSYGSYTVGWTGAINASYDRGATFGWCKVDGTQFKPLTTAYDRNYDYAVLKLGSQCPPGSDEFFRYFDNEDGETTTYWEGNNNWVSGNMSPNIITANTHLIFCLFRYGAGATDRLPNLGVAYGVLARSYRGPEKFPLALASGYVHLDDEDFFNENRFGAGAGVADPAALAADASRIVEPFRDQTSGAVTYVHVVKVSDGTAPRCGSCGGTLLPDGSCTATTPAGYGQSCGGCGGVTQCDGSCTVYSPPNLGQACGCGGVVLCNGACSKPPCDPWGGCASRHCCEPGTTRCRICAPANGACP